MNAMKSVVAGVVCLATFGLCAEVIVPDNPVNELSKHAISAESTNLHEGDGLRLFDGKTDSRWIVKPKPDPSTGVIPTAIVHLLDGAGIAVNAYRLDGHTGEGNAGRYPKQFKLFGSNDGTSWTLLDERDGQTGWTKGEQRLYEVNNITAYSHFKFEVYANNGDSTYTVLGELEFFHFEQTDVLEISADGRQIGEPSPDYGGVSGLEVGDGLTIDCPGKRVNDVDTGDYYALQGFTLTDYAGNVLKEGTTDDLPYEYDHAGYAKLVWKWTSHLDDLLARSQTDITEPKNAERNEITASRNDNGTNVKAVFDNDIGSRWLADSIAKTGEPTWIQYRFLDGSRVVTAFKMNMKTGDSKTRLPLDFVFQGSSDGVNFTDLLSVVGAGKTSESPEDKVYSFRNATPYEYYRLYMTKSNDGTWLELGEMELYTIYRPDTLRVLGAPKCYGHPEPDYGFQENLADGATYQLSGPTDEIEVSDDQKSVCVGYALRINGGEETTVDSTTCTYRHNAGDMAILTWRFADAYRQRFSVKGGGMVDADEKWSPQGATVTVTASVGPNGAPFAGWSGDVPEGVDPSQPTLTYTCDGPRTLVANFSPPLFVSATGSDDNDGSSWDQAFASLARAFAALPANGSLTVGPGTYMVEGGTLVLPTNAKLTASAGPVETIIESAADSVGCLLKAGMGEVTGFTFRGGVADDGDAAGLRLNGTVVSNCVVAACSATGTGASGGGVAMDGASQLLDSTVTNCTSAGNGGGLMLKGGTVRGCTFVGNTAAKSGGGFVVGGTDSVLMTDCTIAGNTAKVAYADNNNAGGGLVLRGITLERLTVRDNKGGGLFLVRDVVLRDSTLSGNSAVRGGGVYAQSADIERCVVSGNSASGFGGGVFIEAGSMCNSLVVSNTSTGVSNGGGGGFFCRKDVVVRNCTVAANNAHNGSGIFVASGAFVLRNSIVAENLTLSAGSTVTNVACHDAALVTNQFANIYQSCLDDEMPNGFPKYAEHGSVVADPLFVDAANGDYHLRAGSPCVNGGAMLDYTVESLDLDRQPRIYNFGKKSSKPDMGCYESQLGAPGMMFLLR